MRKAKRLSDCTATTKNEKLKMLSHTSPGTCVVLEHICNIHTCMFVCVCVIYVNVSIIIILMEIFGMIFICCCYIYPFCIFFIVVIVIIILHYFLCGMIWCGAVQCDLMWCVVYLFLWNRTREAKCANSKWAHHLYNAIECVLFSRKSRFMYESMFSCVWIKYYTFYFGWWFSSMQNLCIINIHSSGNFIHL